jgi:Flp pilus assembly protein TadD
MLPAQANSDRESTLQKRAPALRREALKKLAAELVGSPESVDLRFERACLFAELGENEQAKQEYLEVLGRQPSHAGALNNLGTLLYSIGRRTAARMAYREAVRRHPDQPMAHVNLGNLSLEAGDLIEARAQYEAALAVDFKFAPAHQGLGNLLAELGEEEAAARHHRLGGLDRLVTELPYRGEATPVSILMLVSGRRGDVPVRHLLDDKIFRTVVALPAVYDPDVPLAGHRLVFNAIGDADICRQALVRAAVLLGRMTAPVINHPSAVLKTGRVANARRLGTLPGVVAPRIAALSREILAGPNGVDVLERSGLKFPLLLRPPGFHNGRYFQLVETQDALALALAEIPGDALTAIEFLEARGQDGNTGSIGR